MVWKSSRRRMSRRRPFWCLSRVMTLQARAARRAMAPASSGLYLSTPRAAAKRPMMPLLVGNSSVVRRVKREPDPQDCMGPSRSRARQALLDMGREVFDEVLERHVRDGNLGIASDIPSFLELLVVGVEGFNRLVEQAAFRPNRLLEGVH